MAGVTKKLGYMVAMGTELGGLVGGGALGGALLDDHFNTAPWLALTCLLVGIIAAAWRTAFYIRRLTRDDGDNQ